LDVDNDVWRGVFSWKTFQWLEHVYTSIQNSIQVYKIRSIAKWWQNDRRFGRDAVFKLPILESNACFVFACTNAVYFVMLGSNFCE
jgi:hypothetical protein